MRLRRLEIRALPGIEPGFTLADPAPGLNVVVGPNASGKSSLCRALRALLGPLTARTGAGPVHLVAEFDDDGAALRAERTGKQLEWTRDDVPLEHGPALPEPRFLDCFTIDIDALGAEANDEEIGARVALELAGGYDLGAVRDAFRVKGNAARSERLALRSADDALAKERHRQERIAREEAGLEALYARLADANAAAADAERAAGAIALVAARESLAAAAAGLAAYPPGMERLAGDELERLDELAEKARILATRSEAASAAARRAREVLERAAGLAVDTAAQRAAERDVDALVERERACAADALAVREAEAVLADAVSALGGEPGAGSPRLDRGTLARLEDALESVRGAEAERAAANALLRALGEPREAEDADALRDARRELLRWLGAPPPWAGVLVWLLGAALAGTLALASVLTPPPERWVAPLGAGVLLVLTAALLVAWRALRSGESRAALRARIERDCLELPEAWDGASVRRAVDALDQRLRDALLDARHAERRDEALGRMVRATEGYEAELGKVAALTEALGFEGLRLDASVVRWFELVARWDAARVAVVRARAALAQREGERAESVERIGAFLALADEGAPAADAGAGAFEAAVARAGTRIAERDAARAALDAASRELDEFARQAAENREAHAAILERAGVTGGEAGVRALGERLARLADWREARDAHHRAHTVAGEREAALTARGPLDTPLARALEAGDVGVLGARRDDALERARDRDAHSREIGRIETEAGAARAGDALERARAEVAAARDALAATREAMLDAEAGRAIVDLVERDHVSVARPPVLERAVALFGRFTRGQFALTFDAAAKRFTATDNASKAERRLDELSSGTRMQLLLAVRVAFAREVEPGGPLPMFLDEALATADPERHRAVAESVASLVRDEGRQVFYLSAQPDDARVWAAHAGGDVAVHDLAAIRRTGRVIEPDASLTPPAQPTIPEPGDADVAAYAAAIGATRYDPWLPAEAVHPLHLLHDDLPLLRRLLLTGVDSAGALGVLLDSDAVTVHLDAGQAKRLRWRLRVLEAYRRAWCEGRGKPLTRAVLAEAPSISRAFLGAVGDALEAHAGDAAALVTALDDGDVKRFRKDKIADLRDWLREHGHLDERPVLGPLERALRVEWLLREAIESGTATSAGVREVIGWLDAGREANASDR